jgi:uncharacterized membrane protein affecting hemolysin expression
LDSLYEGEAYLRQLEADYSVICDDLSKTLATQEQLSQKIDALSIQEREVLKPKLRHLKDEQIRLDKQVCSIDITCMAAQGHLRPYKGFKSAGHGRGLEQQSSIESSCQKVSSN